MPDWLSPHCDAGACAEVLPGAGTVQIRSSLARDEVATLTLPEWDALVDVIRAGHGDAGPRRIQDGDTDTTVHFTPAEWTAFVDAIRAGEYDRIGTDHA